MSNLRTPLYDWHVSHKVRMVSFGGWDMPVQYTSIMEEHKAVRSSVGVFDISHMGRLSFAGKDTLSFIQKVFTNDAATMKEGQVRYGLICNEQGGVLDDVLVYRWSYGWSMIVNASNRVKILDWFTQHKGTLDVQIIDQTMDTSLIAVQGPKAVDVCQGMFADAVEFLKYYFATPTRYRDKGCIVSRTGYTGEDGFEIGVNNTQVVELIEELVTKGCVLGGLGCRDTLRLEAAMPLYGHELGETIDPFQAEVGWAVKLEKGDFLGREALRNIKDAPRRRRVGLVLDGKRAAREGCTVWKDNQTVGTITSGSFAPWLEQSIAMAFVDPTSVSVGTELIVDIRGSQTPAKVVALPFYKRTK